MMISNTPRQPSMPLLHTPARALDTPLTSLPPRHGRDSGDALIGDGGASGRRAQTSTQAAYDRLKSSIDLYA